MKGENELVFSKKCIELLDDIFVNKEDVLNDKSTN